MGALLRVRLAGLPVTNLILEDVLVRTWKPSLGIMTSNEARITRQEARLDLYICGFLCTPFTTNGTRQAYRRCETICLQSPSEFELQSAQSVSKRP